MSRKTRKKPSRKTPELLAKKVWPISIKLPPKLLLKKDNEITFINFHKYSITLYVYSSVLAFPPKSPVTCDPSFNVLKIAF